MDGVHTSMGESVKLRRDSAMSMTKSMFELISTKSIQSSVALSILSSMGSPYYSGAVSASKMVFGFWEPPPFLSTESFRVMPPDQRDLKISTVSLTQNSS
ncbi:hypothetical protein D5086_002562 [Populus alba]|uniref:Uncharacterized protein n=1 Tax=Populus alba TaxID=43335 RepID=A0ACC4D227_POPAL